MGRLFWKILLGFWLTLVATGAAIGVVVHSHNEARLAEMAGLAAGPRAELTLAAVATTLQHGGISAVETLFADWPGRAPPAVLVVDAEGKDSFGRRVPEAALAQARTGSGEGRGVAVRQTTTPDGRDFLLFVPRQARTHGRPHHPYASPQERFLTQLGVTGLASLLFSAGLAWYLARPVRHLRHASRLLADGALATRVTPLIGSRRDEIAELGRDFDHMATRLQALMGAQKRLLHDVSHEVRSPLARLRLAVGLARQQPERMNSALERIERETERLDDLVAQVLTLSRLEAGGKDASEDYVDLTELLASVVADARFEATAIGRGVNLSTGPEIIVKANAELLHRAFENVIRNGVKHTVEGTSVDISIALSEPWVSVSVCDYGPGVAEPDLGHVFEPFFRVQDQSRSGGYGLGLAIARRAVEAHGGHISAANRPGGGLCITVSLRSATAVE
jgi:two-component system OmpR family sensor kinase